MGVGEPRTIREATAEDAVEGAAPRWVVEPGSAEELAAALAWAGARGLCVMPRGGGTKITWGGPPGRGDVVLSTRRLGRVIEHAAGDMTATVEAGCTVAALQQVLAQRGQRVALDPLWPDRATVGGVIATNDGGPLRAAYGPVRDLILGVTVALADGTLASSGGKVVKNVAGYDLPKLMVGAFGTLGVITSATFRLHPLPAATRTIQFAARTPEDAQRFVLAVQKAGPPVTGLQVSGGSEAWRVAVRLEGSVAGVDAMAGPVEGLAAGAGMTLTSESQDPWSERERLWQQEGAVAKVTFLPTQLAAVCGAMRGTTYKLVAQALGVGLVAVPGTSMEQAEALAGAVRTLGGSLVILRGTPELKRRVDPLRDASGLPLMRRIKEQFDPAGMLNPGRVTGGI